MPWPIAMDYQDALQSPHLCLNDPTLKTGKPKCDQFGMPILASGNFASVCQLQCNGQKYAVRCFVKYRNDQERRYAEISNFLGKSRLPCMAGFEFQKQGVLIRGQWYPILKMEWIDGQPLDRYVKANLTNPQAIRTLATQFLAMVKSLRNHSIAHGDLQHGNIIVTNSGLRLVDYDGMYVPALAGMQNWEKGHPNYQHPLRNQQHFGPYLDNFSVWVIYVSLVALSIDSSLWYECGNAEDQLLFRMADFADPTLSDGFRCLQSSPEHAIKSLSQSLRGFLSIKDLSKIPLLEDSQLPALPSMQPQDNYAILGATGNDWIDDWTSGNKPAAIARSYTQERISLALAFGVGSALIWPLGIVAGIVLLLVLCAAIVGIFRSNYETLPEAKRRAELMPQLAQLEPKAREAEQLLQNQEEAKKKRIEEQRLKTNEITRHRHEFAQKERTEVDACEYAMQVELRKNESQRQSLNQTLANDLKQALDTLQRLFLNNQLKRFRVSNGNIKGIGPQLNQRLAEAGFETAADIVDIDIQQVYSGGYNVARAYIVTAWGTKVGIEGIGPDKAANLLEWKRGLTTQFKSGMPKSIPVSDESRIRSAYQQKLNAIQFEENSLKQNAQVKKAQIRQRLQQEQERLARSLKDTMHSFAKENDVYEKKLREQKNEVSKIRAMLRKLQEENRYLSSFTFQGYLRRIVMFRKAA